MLRRLVVVPNGRVTINLCPHHRKTKHNFPWTWESRRRCDETEKICLGSFSCFSSYVCLSFIFSFFFFLLRNCTFYFPIQLAGRRKVPFYFVSVNADKRLLNLKDLNLESLTLKTQRQKHWGFINQPWPFVLLSLQRPIAACLRVGLDHVQFHGTPRPRWQNPASQRRAPLVKCELQVFTTQSQKST